MMLAHLPAGYLLTTHLMRRASISSRALLACGLIAGIFPDADLLFFYLVDARQFHHHDYWLHRPVFWCGVFLIALLLSWIKRYPQTYIYLLVIFSNLLLHLSLDTMAGGIQWLYPLSDTRYVVIEIPSRYDWWVWSFILHWTFALEILIIIAAIIQWKRTCRTPS